MTDNKRVDELKNELQKNLDLLRSWRDDVRLRLHLASLDAKDEWRKLEPELAEVEKAAEQFGDKSRDALSGALKSLARVRDSLR